ncbi:hypothetical protein [Phenylobacterium aquaticum]|uniref:hypothetical protein n=1 Tax=Phenylobacterium aquaticum TaxID=1763816 RepID=UPI0026F01972|nr:hypothetical protein [Phenylobacterium aquaticum]
MANGGGGRRWGRSTVAVVGGLAAVVGLSTGTDAALQAVGVFPSGGKTMGQGLFALAFGYRALFGVAGGWIAARLAQARPVAHAVVLGGIGLALSLMGVAVSLGHPEMGPGWYPIALAVTALPLSWLGGLLARRA